MSNWPINIGARAETLGKTTGGGTAVASGAGSKGSYGTIGTTTFPWAGFHLTLYGVNDRYRFDIAINMGGSDIVIVEDYFIDFTHSDHTPVAMMFPVRIPSGAVIKLRGQSNGTNDAVILLTGYMQDFPGVLGASRIVSATTFSGDAPASKVTTTGTTYTAWTQVIASTPVRFTGLFCNVGNGGNFFGRTACNYLIDIAVGGSGSEVRLFSFLSQTVTFVAIFPFFIPCDIPAGSRISFRVQASSGGSADVVDCAVMGLAA